MAPRLCALLFGIILSVTSTACGSLDRWKLTTGPNLPAAKGKPHISAIEDLGTVLVPDRGKIPHTPGDGMVVPGETILIRGHGFGRLPTVLVSGRPTSVLGRTEDGGILVRIPKGVEAPCRILVTNTKGSTSQEVPFRRHLLSTDPDGTLRIDDVTGPLPKQVPGPALTGVRALAMHRLGSVAYLLDRTGNLIALDLAAAKGPKSTGTFGNEAPQLIATASEADVLVTVGKGKVALWDTSHPTRPSHWKTYSLPAKLELVTGAALSPDGKTLALATTHGLLLADVTDPLGLRWASKAPQPVTQLRIREIGILHENPKAAHDRQTLWILAGDNRQSVSLDNHGIQLFSASLHEAASGEDLPSVKHPRKVDLSVPWTPTTWGITFGTTEVVSGTALRQDPARMLAYVPTMPTDLLRVPRPYDSPAATQALAGMATGQAGMLFVLDGTGAVRKKLKSPLLFAITAATTGSLVWARGCHIQRQKGAKEKTTLVLECGLLVTAGEGSSPTWHPDGKTRPVTELDDLTRQRILVQP